jgi:3-oxoacyl-[acyl-carrier protein] reductase
MILIHESQIMPVTVLERGSMLDNKSQMRGVHESSPGLFTGRSIAVVGAASGIGRACALRLSLLGASVACLDQDIEGCEETVAQIGSAGGDSLAMMIDLSKIDSVVTAMDETISRLGVLDGVLNTAGITGVTGISTHEVDVDDFDFVYQVNLRGAFALSQVVLPHMLERGYGRILHIASIAGKEGNAGMAAYSSTKAGLIGLVKTMGKEYATTGVTVNAIAPAVIWTPMVEALPQTQIDYMTERIPMARTGTLKEIVDMVTFVLSSECSFTTGFTFDLTGGRAVY